MQTAKKNTFDNYVTWTTRYGAELTDINDAIEFLPYHEGLHTGVIMSLMKLVKANAPASENTVA